MWRTVLMKLLLIVKLVISTCLVSLMKNLAVIFPEKRGTDYNFFFSDFIYGFFSR